MPWATIDYNVSSQMTLLDNMRTVINNGDSMVPMQ